MLVFTVASPATCLHIYTEPTQAPIHQSNNTPEEPVSSDSELGACGSSPPDSPLMLAEPTQAPTHQSNNTPEDPVSSNSLVIVALPVTCLQGWLLNPLNCCFPSNLTLTWYCNAGYQGRASLEHHTATLAIKVVRHWNITLTLAIEAVRHWNNIII